MLREDRVAVLVRELLVALGEDPDREGLRRTPQRVADNWRTMFAGVGADAAAALDRVIPVRESGAPSTEAADAGGVAVTGVVLLRDIRFRSVCERHLMPFAGVAHVAYLPGADVVGFGALVRVVELVAARPQVQERLGEEIAAALQDALAPRGVLVVLDASHPCGALRGAVQPPTSTLTIAARGAYLDPLARAELMALVAARPAPP